MFIIFKLCLKISCFADPTQLLQTDSYDVITWHKIVPIVTWNALYLNYRIFLFLNKSALYRSVKRCLYKKLSIFNETCVICPTKERISQALEDVHNRLSYFAYLIMDIGYSGWLLILAGRCLFDANHMFRPLEHAV